MDSQDKKPESNTESGEHLGRSFVTWANAGMLGFHMITGPLLGIFLGYHLDKWLDSRPVCVGIGLVLGLIAGGLNMYRDLRRILREQAAEDARAEMRRLGLGSGTGAGLKKETDMDKSVKDNRHGPSDADDDGDYNNPASGYGRGQNRADDDG